MPLEAAVAIVEEADRRVTGDEYTAISPQLLSLAVESGCSAYDCELMVFAKDLRVPLVTTDRQILKAFPAVAVSPTEFVG